MMVFAYWPQSEAMQQEVSQWYGLVNMGTSRMILARRPQEQCHVAVRLSLVRLREDKLAINDVSTMTRGM